MILPLSILLIAIVQGQELTRRKRDAAEASARQAIAELKADLNGQAGLQATLDAASGQLGEVKSHEQLARIGAAAQKVAGCLVLLRSSKTEEVMQGIMMAMQVGADFLPPPGGTILSTVLGVAAGIFGSINKPSLQTVLTEALQRELSKAAYEELMNDVSGAVFQLSSAHAYIRGLIKTPVSNWTYDDFNGMGQQVTIIQGTHVLGQLKREIKNRKKSINNSRQTLALMSGYGNVMMLRNSLLYMVFAIHSQAKRTRASPDAIQSTIDHGIADAKELFRFVHEPNPNEAHAVALMNRRKYKVLVELLESLDINPFKSQDEFGGGCFVFYNGYWPSYHIGFKQGSRSEVNVQKREMEVVERFLQAVPRRGSPSDGWPRVEFRKTKDGFVKNKIYYTKAFMAMAPCAYNFLRLRLRSGNDVGEEGLFRMVKMSNGNYYWIDAKRELPIEMQQETIGWAKKPKTGTEAHWKLTRC